MLILGFPDSDAQAQALTLSTLSLRTSLFRSLHQTNDKLIELLLACRTAQTGRHPHHAGRSLSVLHTPRQCSTTLQLINNCISGQTPLRALMPLDIETVATTHSQNKNSRVM